MIICGHRPPCPGCPRLGERGIAFELAGAIESLARETGAEVEPLMEGRGEEYRLRSRLALRGRRGRPLIGLFQEGSHDIVDIPRCPIHAPEINQVAQHLKEVLRRYKLDFYRESSGHGCLRYAQLVVERSSRKVQLTLVVNEEDPARLGHAIDTLNMEVADQLHSIWITENRYRGNRILGERFERMSGPRFVFEDFAGAGLHFHPGAFGQANLDLAERMVRFIHQQVPADTRLLEYHAGVGAIGLGLLPQLASYRANEIGAYSLLGLRAALTKSDNENAAELAGPAVDHLDALAHADVVVCDPPRRGLEPELLEALREQRPEHLIVLHCGFKSAMRDLRRLADGAFRLERILPVALFPYTRHVELVSVLHPT